MKVGHFRQKIKPLMMPIAIVAGIFFHKEIEAVAFLAPALIFAMLLITFCRIRLSEVRIDRMSWLLLAVQLPVSLAAYFAVRPFSEVAAQGFFICIFCPTATAAPVITQMLGGSIARLVSFSLVSNAAVALTAPWIFAAMGDGDVDVLTAMLSIARHVVPLILAPLALAVIIGRTLPRVHIVLSEKQAISFYLWSISLIIVVGRAVSFVMSEPAEAIPLMVTLALLALVACAVQFAVGRRIGRACGDRIAGAQGLGQKNTVLAIWMALTYLNPLTSVAPAAYVLWQNTFNSAQLYLKMRRGDSAPKGGEARRQKT